MSNEIVIRQEQDDFMPVLSTQQAGQRYQAIRQFIAAQMVAGRDYGRIPGTDKDTLLKPGAEKLCTLFGLSANFSLVERVEDWSGDDHSGEPFFYYLYRCTLHRGERLIATGDGSCNSRESKYRWREAKRTCPYCGAPAIIKGKEEYGGGWVCFKKQGGCGAKFNDNDQAITGQQAGKVPNPDIADLVNTLQKMAQKRALIAATLIGVNASDYFTQDMEDFSPSGGAYAETATAEQQKPSAPKRSGSDNQRATATDDDPHAELRQRAAEATGRDVAAIRNVKPEVLKRWIDEAEVQAETEPTGA
jgi:hypothetical protein